MTSMTPIARPRHQHTAQLHPEWVPPTSQFPDPTPHPAPPPPADDDDRTPITSLDRETIARELRDDPTLAREFRADPWLAAQIADLIGPQPLPVRPLSLTADPTHPEPPGDPAASATTALPLRERIYTLYCQGHSRLAIARALDLDRGTIARHLAAVQRELAEDHRAAMSAQRDRAVDAHRAILAAAWDALAREEAHETEWLANARIPYPPTDTKIVPYHAQRARLLAIAERAARTIAQLQGLFTPLALQAALRDSLPTGSTDSTDPADSAAPTDLASPLAPCDTHASDLLPAPEDYPANSIRGLAPTTPPAPESPPASIGAFGGRPPAPTTPPAPGGDPDTTIADLAPDPIAASCGMPASDTSASPPDPADYPSNSIRGLAPTTPPASRDYPGDPIAGIVPTAPVVPAALCGMLPSAAEPARATAAHR